MPAVHILDCIVNYEVDIQNILCENEKIRETALTCQCAVQVKFFDHQQYRNAVPLTSFWKIKKVFVSQQITFYRQWMGKERES